MAEQVVSPPSADGANRKTVGGPAGRFPMADKQVIDTAGAPQNDNPYSQGILTDGLLFVSGQGPTDPETGEQILDDVGAATERTLENVKAIVESSGGSLEDVVKVTVYLRDMDDYGAMNEVYGTFFEAEPPARVCIQAGRLPGDIPVEIEAFARVE
jgi:2-iminobutanoate/2-iminopropanoate deaminase